MIFIDYNIYNTTENKVNSVPAEIMYTVVCETNEIILINNKIS